MTLDDMGAVNAARLHLDGLAPTLRAEALAGYDVPREDFDALREAAVRICNDDSDEAWQQLRDALATCGVQP